MSPANTQCITCLRASGKYIVDVRTEGLDTSDGDSQNLCGDLSSEAKSRGGTDSLSNFTLGL